MNYNNAVARILVGLITCSLISLDVILPIVMGKAYGATAWPITYLASLFAMPGWLIIEVDADC